MKSGVDQSRINAPWFFNMYLNDLMVKLRINNGGCHIDFVSVGCLITDHILLLYSSILLLQCILELWCDIGDEYGT